MSNKINCSYCCLPRKGGVTGNNYCICNDTVEIDRIKSMVKYECGSCGTGLIDVDPLKRYFTRGNYCTECNAKSSNVPFATSEKTYEQYLESSGYNIKRVNLEEISNE